MASRQIHIVGVIGACLLILIIINFFGRDLYKEWSGYNVSNPGLPEKDPDQIIMKKSALEDLTKTLNSESDHMISENIKEHLKKDDKKKSNLAITGDNSHKVTKKEKIQKRSDLLLQVKASLKQLLSAHKFLQNSTDLNDKDKNILDKAILLLKPFKEDIEIVVEGHTQAGAPSFVSLDMAEKVAYYLKQNLPSVKVQSIGYENRYPISGDIYDISNKRVEIIIKNRSGV